jgi:phage-related protein
MAPLLGEGEKGIRSLMEEAKNLKIGISTEDLQSIAKADDAMARMKSSLSSVVSNIAVSLAPVFEQISNSLTEILPQIAEMARSLSGVLAEAMKTVGDMVDSDVIPKLKEFLTVSADLLAKWSAMPEKWKFLGEIIAAAISLAVETIKADWRDMLDDMLKATAEKAKTLMGMLNPTTYTNSVLDYLSSAENADYSGGVGAGAESSQAKAERRFENLMRQLNGEAPIAGPDPKKLRPDRPQETPDELAAKLQAAMAGDAALNGKDPNVAATEKQTNKLVDALKNYGSPKLNIVPEIGP